MADDRDSDSKINFNRNRRDQADAEGGDRYDPKEYAVIRGSSYRHYRQPHK